MKMLKAMLLSIAVTAASSAVLLLLLALIFGKGGSLPKAIMPIITTVAGCAAVFLGAFFASMYSREKGALIGIGSGLLFALCAALVSTFAYQHDFDLASAGKLAALLLGGSIGGILGVNRKSKVKF